MKINLYYIELHTRDGKVQYLDSVRTPDRAVARATARRMQNDYPNGTVRDRWVMKLDKQGETHVTTG
jgi:hypothetical protein